MTERTEKCFACRFYEEVDSLAKKGTCHRFPPSVMPDGRSDVHPVVQPENWCGEFRWPKSELETIARDNVEQVMALDRNSDLPTVL